VREPPPCVGPLPIITTSAYAPTSSPHLFSHLPHLYVLWQHHGCTPHLTALKNRYNTGKKKSGTAPSPAASSGHRVYTYGFVSDHMMLKVCDRSSNTKPGWDKEFNATVQEVPEFGQKLRIDHVKFLRSKDKADDHHKSTINLKNGRTFEKLWPVYIRSTNSANNTVEARCKWGKAIAAVLTVKGAPKETTGGAITRANVYEFAGDLTPTEEPIYLGNHLTITDTVEVAIESLDGIDSQDAFLANEDLVAMYFGPSRVKEVISYYRRFGICQSDESEASREGGEADELRAIDLQGILSDDEGSHEAASDAAAEEAP